MRGTNIAPAAGTAGQNYSALVNRDYSTSKGVEFKFTMRRRNRISAFLSYYVLQRDDNRIQIRQAPPTSGPPVPSSHCRTTRSPRTGIRRIVEPFFRLPFRQERWRSVLEQPRLEPPVELQQRSQFHSLDCPAARASADRSGFRTPCRADRVLRLLVLPARCPFGQELHYWSDGPQRVRICHQFTQDENPVGAFFRTGDPADDGWFSSPEGRSDAVSHGRQYVDVYRGTAPATIPATMVRRDKSGSV